jgi:hypothetical protein
VREAERRRDLFGDLAICERRRELQDAEAGELELVPAQSIGIELSSTAVGVKSLCLEREQGIGIATVDSSFLARIPNDVLAHRNSEAVAMQRLEHEVLEPALALLGVREPAREHLGQLLRTTARSGAKAERRSLDASERRDVAMERIVSEPTELTRRQAGGQIDDRPLRRCTRYLTDNRDVGLDEEPAAVAPHARDLRGSLESCRDLDGCRPGERQTPQLRCALVGREGRFARGKHCRERALFEALGNPGVGEHSGVHLEKHTARDSPA